MHSLTLWAQAMAGEYPITLHSTMNGLSLEPSVSETNSVCVSKSCVCRIIMESCDS